MWDLELRKPSKQTVVGFVVAWLGVIGVILLTLLIVGIGA